MSTLDHVRWLSKPSLKQPVIVTAFTGWNDAADAASNAVRNLIEGWRAQPLAEIDPEAFTDFATIRPHVRLKDGGVRSIVWPTVGMWHVAGAGGDIILVLGPEPSLRWRTFSEQLMGVADHFGASMMLTLGALLADVPHSPRSDHWHFNRRRLGGTVFVAALALRRPYRHHRRVARSMRVDSASICGTVGGSTRVRITSALA
jgi:hypothetical protein